jgi:hypothetical protein
MLRSASRETKTGDSGTKRVPAERESQFRPLHSPNGNGSKGWVHTSSAEHSLAAIHRAFGNQAVLRSLSPRQPTIQTKLTINAPGREGTGGTPTSWTLKIMIDAEAASAKDVGLSTVGHTCVEFSNSTSAAYTYGFYPDTASATPDSLYHTQVSGCMVHPDTNHASCVDYTETVALSQAQYQTALAYAQSQCRKTPDYNLQTNNCTTFASDVSVLVGHSLPPIRGVVGFTTLVLADNPYTLIEGLRRRATGPTYDLTSDSDLRDAIAGASAAELSRIPAAEKIRVINRLLDGWVSDDDIQAIETLCAGVATQEEMTRIRVAMLGRQRELNKAQGTTRSVPSQP